MTTVYCLVNYLTLENVILLALVIICFYNTFNKVNFSSTAFVYVFDKADSKGVMGVIRLYLSLLNMYRRKHVNIKSNFLLINLGIFTM